MTIGDLLYCPNLNKYYLLLKIESGGYPVDFLTLLETKTKFVRCYSYAKDDKLGFIKKS